MKKKLQDITDLKVMSFKEAAKALGWSVEEDDTSYYVTCDCESGNKGIRYSGFFGIEVIECKNCHKRMIDLFSPAQTGNSTGACLDSSQFEIEKDDDGNDRYWVAEDNNGGIQVKIK